MYKRTTIYATILALISLYIIFGAGLHIDEMLIFNAKNKDLADNVNKVLLNLSYSYITGYIVYLLTLFIPHTKTTNKIRPVVIYKFSIIENELDKCIKAFCFLSDRQDSSETYDAIARDDQPIVDTPIDYDCSLKISDFMRSYLWEYLIKRKDRILPIISDLIEYRDYISSDSLILLEEIRNSDFFERLGSDSFYVIANKQQNTDGFFRNLFDDLCFVHNLTQTAGSKLF